MAHPECETPDTYGKTRKISLHDAEHFFTDLNLYVRDPARRSEIMGRLRAIADRRDGIEDMDYILIDAEPEFDLGDESMALRMNNVIERSEHSG